MKVVILGPYPVDRDRILGGVEGAIVYLSEELIKYGDVELHIVTGLPGLTSEMVRRYDGLAVHFLPQSQRFATITRSWADVRRMVKKLRQIDPDVVHAQGITASADAALASGYPSVVTVHGIIEKDLLFEHGFKNRLRAVLSARHSRSILERAKHLIAISPYVLEAYRVPPRSHVYHLESPVHRKFFGLESKPVGKRMLFAGRVIPRKRVLELLQSLKEIRKLVPEVELRIAGDKDADPAYLSRLLSYIRDNNLEDNVSFLGFLGETQVLEEYASCSLLVLNSIQETFPLVIAQALAAGKPVVSTRICGVPYMVQDGETGLLVEPGDTAGFADAVVALLSDDVRRREMGRRGREFAMRFRSDEIARKTLAVYQTLLNVS